MLHLSFVLVHEVYTTPVVPIVYNKHNAVSVLIFLGIEIVATQQIKGF